jgi:hypothetical protein
MKMIVEKQMECRLAGETEVLGENLPQRHEAYIFVISGVDPQVFILAQLVEALCYKPECRAIQSSLGAFFLI